MKRIVVFLLSIVTIWGITACSKKEEAPTPEKTLGKGEHYLDGGDYEEALEQFLLYIELEPEEEYGYICAAAAYAEMDKPDKAVNILEKGLEKTEGVGIQGKLDELEALTVSAIDESEQGLKPQTPEPKPEQTRILTVSDVAFLDMGNIKSIDFVDETGTTVPMPSAWSEWFENAEVGDVTFSGQLHMEINSSGSYDYSLMDGSMLRFVFLVDGKEYPIGVCKGTRFAVKETSGGYALLPEETAEMSPPPIEEEALDNTDAGPIDDWFENVTWSGTSVSLTAKKEAVVAGISVFADEQEYLGDIITNYSGDMGLTNGSVAWPGSKLSLARNPVIIFAGTTASCEVDTGGASPERVCIYLESGEELAKDL